MSYFRCGGAFAVGKETQIQGDAARHIRDARRVKVGEDIEVQDEGPRRFLVKVIGAERDTVTVLPMRELALPESPKRHVILLQALISEQSLDLILQKATELGAGHVVLFEAENSPHPIPEGRLPHKRERWQRIMDAACEQSGRPTPPSLSFAGSLERALASAQGTLFLLDVSGATRTSTASDAATIIVGPEGGLTEHEKSLASSRGATSLTLGPYTLRAETAAIAGTAHVVTQ